MSDENALANPLAEIIRRAAKSPAQDRVGKVEKRWEGATPTVVAVLDCSGSMADSIGCHNLSKYDHLKIALKDVRQGVPGLRLVAFNGLVVEVAEVDDLPEPYGSTDLAGALVVVQKFKPSKTIIISDGLPDDAAAAVRAVEGLTGQVDTIYCGPDGHAAIQFLRSLSRRTGGVSMAWDGYHAPLAEGIRGLLAAPAIPR
jgi:hypothetical protein